MRSCTPRARAALATLLTLALASPPVAAAPPDRYTRERVEAVLAEANRAAAAGDDTGAAERYAEAFALLPESPATADSRALALLDSVQARRQAFTRGGDAGHLCAARALIDRYLAEAAVAYGQLAATMDGPASAAQQRRDIEADLVTAGTTCPEDQVPAPRPAPPPPPRVVPDTRPRPRPWAIAGGTVLGLGGLLLIGMGVALGVGASAEASGRELRREQPTRDIDALLASSFYRRGQAANELALAGGVLGGVALVVGAALLLAGARGRARRGAALRLRPAPGLALQVRF